METYVQGICYFDNRKFNVTDLEPAIFLLSEWNRENAEVLHDRLVSAYVPTFK
jgi:hypothetical protein